jgi:hypothetical protein
MQTSFRSLTQQERSWVAEILSGHTEWSEVDVNEIHVLREHTTGNMRTVELSNGKNPIPSLRGTRGYIGRIEARTADNFGITVTLDQYNGLLAELHIDFLDLQEPGNRAKPNEWKELVHIYTKM